jgi:hypothetical protein
MGTPQTSLVDGTAAADVDFSMLNSLVAQQNMYNAPEVNWITGTLYRPMSTFDMWNFETSEGANDLNFSIVNTEIARRASLMSQPLGKALAAAETNDTGEVIMAMPLFKEGTINQGGPADIMARRIAITLEGDRCDSWQPGPGPGGVQPFLDEAVLTCEFVDGQNVCSIEVTGEICVSGENLGTQVILALYEGTANPSDEPLCDDFIDIVTSPTDSGTEFSGVCVLEPTPVVPEELPCTVKVITGPGTTAGGGQASEPIDVTDADGDLVCNDCTIQVDALLPSIDFARYFVLDSGNGRIEMQVDGLDGDLTTAVETRNAVTEDRIVRRLYDGDPAGEWVETTEDFYYRIAVGPGTNRPIPCAVQVADVDGNLEFGPWIPVQDAPAECAGPIPPACQ